MGQTLSEPVTAKETAYCQNDQYKVGSSCMQGWRIHMEDSHTHILSLPDDPETAFFGVYDGHGGASVAQYAGKHLHKLVVKRAEFKTNVPLAMKQAFLDIDEKMLSDESMQSQMAGSTAVTCIIKDRRLYCANAGDSRMIACINDKVELLSHDHKPNNENELKRIYEGGGFVEYNRVNGNLALSRALGDFVFKRNSDKIPEEQIVTAFPDIEEREITADWEFAVLACDGIWDVMRNEEVKQFVRQRIAKGMTPDMICEQLMTCCLAPDCLMGGLGGDNMTVVVVCFLHGRPWSDLVARCASSLNAPEQTFQSLAKRNSALQMTEAQRLREENVRGTSDDEDEDEDDEEEDEDDDAAHDAEAASKGDADGDGCGCESDAADKKEEAGKAATTTATAAERKKLKQQKKHQQQQNQQQHQQNGNVAESDSDGSPQRLAAGGNAESIEQQLLQQQQQQQSQKKKVQRPTVRKGERCSDDDDDDAEADLK